MSARIKIVGPQEASGKLKALYSKFQNKMANILAVHSLNPDSLEAHLNYYRAIMFGRSPLPRRTREIIATVVSAVNNCHYWVQHHGAALHTLTKDEQLIKQLIADYTKADLDAKTRGILDYAVKLTEHPSGVKDADVHTLRELGCEDGEILDVCQITSYFNFVNRMAEGLGVELEN